jgi:uncharacterized protein
MSEFVTGNYMMDELRPLEIPATDITAANDSPTLPPPAPPRSITQKIFIGADGLRPVWCLLLYALLVFGIGFGLSSLMRVAQIDNFSKVWSFLSRETGAMLSAIVPGFIMAKIEGRPFGAYGLPRQSAFNKLFWAGMIWGIGGLTALMLTLRGMHAFYFGGAALHGLRVFKFALFWIVFFLIVAFFEEFLLRGYTQFTLARGITFWPAALLLSIAFGAIHLGNQGEDRIGALGAAAIGLFFCLTLRRTGNLWFAVGMHTSWNWGETYLYSVPNSGMVVPGHLLKSSFQGPSWLTGGSVGPEASLFVFVLIGGLWILFHRLYPDVKYQT